MKIGVFGDSFADITERHLFGWPRMVHEQLGGTVGYHAWSGTSHWWSYQQFLKHHQNYDLVVFVHTSPSRWCALPASCAPGWQYNVGYHQICDELDVLNKYFFDVFPDELRAFISENIFHEVNTRCQQHHQHLVNLMMHTPQEHPIRPTSFPVIWNLDGLSRQERMPDESISITDWLHERQIPDERVCHFHEQHNQQLADQVVALLRNKTFHQQLHLV